MCVRRWMVGATLVVGTTLLGLPASAEVEDMATPREGPPGTEVVIRWTHDECQGQLVAYIAELRDRPRFEAGHAPFRAPDNVFVIPAVPRRRVPDLVRVSERDPGRLPLRRHRTATGVHR